VEETEQGMDNLGSALDPKTGQVDDMKERLNSHPV
jgi:hypothetical protein